MMKRIAVAGVLAGTVLTTGAARADPEYMPPRGPAMEQRFDHDGDDGRFAEFRERMRDRRERFEARLAEEREWTARSYGWSSPQLSWLDQRQTKERARFEGRERRMWRWMRERREGRREWRDWRG